MLLYICDWHFCLSIYVKLVVMAEVPPEYNCFCIHFTPSLSFITHFFVTQCDKRYNTHPGLCFLRLCLPSMIHTQPGGKQRVTN